MSDHYPDPPTTAQTGFPLISEAEDPEDYRDVWGDVIDDLVSRRLEEYLTGQREIPGIDVDEAVARTLSTEQASTGTVPGHGDNWRITDRKTPSSGTTEIVFDDFGGHNQYCVQYQLQHDVDTEDDVYLRINGHGDGNEDYWYYDASATKQEDEDEFLLARHTSTDYIGGYVYVGNAGVSDDDGQRTGITSIPFLNGRSGRTVDFGREGGVEVTETVSSIDITVEGGVDTPSGRTVFQLWEREFE